MHRVRHWSSRLHFYAGKVVLVRSVLNGMRAYWSQLFIFPKKLVRKITSICRDFLWGNTAGSRRYSISWEQLCCPFSCGGLNIQNFELWNRAIVMKQLWNVCSKKERLCVKWLHAYYIKSNDIMSVRLPTVAT